MDDITTVADSVLAKNGLKPKPSVRRRLIIDQVSQSRGQPGNVVNVNMDSAQPFLRDAMGRVAHIIGIRLVSAVKLTQTGTQTGDLTPNQLRGLWQNVRLQGRGGHVFTEAGCDGRTIIFDSFAREGRVLNQPWNQDVNGDGGAVTLYPVPSVDTTPFGVKAADASPQWRDISLDINLIGKHGLAGIMPMAELMNNNGLLRFQLNKQIPRVAQNWTVAQYAVQGEAQNAVRVEFDVLYLDSVMSSRRWILDDYTMTDITGTFKYPGFRHSYIAARWREEDIGGAGAGNPYGALTQADAIDNLLISTYGGTQEIMGLTAVQLRERLRQLVSDYPNGEVVTWDRASALPALAPSATTQPNDGSDYLGRLCDFYIAYNKKPAYRPIGTVGYTMASGSMPANGLLRVVHRVEGALSESPIAAAVNCGCAHASSKPTVTADDHGNHLITVPVAGPM